jgi:uncharacterized membrane protein
LKFKALNVILIIDVISLLLILSMIFIPSTIVRVILGLPFLLFFPGYTLLAAISPKKEEIDKTERIVTVFGLSLAAIVFIGFGLNYTPWGIRLVPFTFFLTSFIFVTSAIALTRRILILKIEKFTAEFTMSLPGWNGSRLNKLVSIVLIAMIFGTLGTLIYTLAAPKIGGEFSEFYILGNNGRADDYPSEYIMGNGKVNQVIYDNGTTAISGLGTVVLGIVNQEHKAASYSVQLTINGEPAKITFDGTLSNVLGPIKLQQGQMWENEIGIAPDQIGNNQKVELLLFNGNSISPEDTLHFWINVKQAN